MYLPPPKHVLKIKTHDALHYLETPCRAFQDIYKKNHQDQQLSSVFPWVRREQEDGKIGAQQDSDSRCP